ncbi:MAG: DUF3795 domain-containing protein [Candidatus Heimdallarchaeota archaeon]
MSKIIAYCGITCSNCPAYIATQKNDKNALQEVSKTWSSGEMKFSPEELLCDGCISNQRLFSWCEKCDIRNCAREKDLKNCAYCKNYPCETLENVFGKDVSAKETLDEIKSSSK